MYILGYPAAMKLLLCHSLVHQGPGHQVASSLQATLFFDAMKNGTVKRAWQPLIP